MRFPVDRFKGLNTVSDPRILGLQWQKRADNVDITSDGGMDTRNGYDRLLTLTANDGAYATRDELRAYLADSGTLYAVDLGLSKVAIAAGMITGPVFFAEQSGIVYGTNGTNYFTIDQQNIVRRWGVPQAPAPACVVATGTLKAGMYRVVAVLVDANGLEGSNSRVVELNIGNGKQIIVSPVTVAGYSTRIYVTAQNGKTYKALGTIDSGAINYDHTPEYLGIELRHWFTHLPRGEMPAFYKLRCWLAEFFPDLDQTVIWSSAPLDFHHFDTRRRGITVPGRCVLLKGTDAGLLIGTEREIYGWDSTAPALTKLADYGAVPGYHDAEINGRLLFWTQRGLCRAFPFENLTDRTVSVPPGAFAGAGVIEDNGNIRYVVSLEVGTVGAYNARSPKAVLRMSMLDVDINMTD